MNLTSHSRARAHGRPVSVLHEGDPAGHEHLVEFYDSEDFLVGTVSGFLAPALNAGDAAVVVATADHRRAFEAALGRSGLDVAGAVASGRYLSFDAAELLESFMIDGAPDRGRFADTAGRIIERAGAGGRRVRIYGEMVALLLDAGEVVSAVALEDLWNDVAANREFMLLCAYPMRSFETSAKGEAFRRICDQHTTVIPSEDYSLVGGADAQQRAVASLQQQAAALKADLALLRADQIVTELHYVDALASKSRPHRVDFERSRPAAFKGAPLASTQSNPRGSPGGRLLLTSLGTLSSRLRYSDHES
jgi:hypothetical protein